MRNNSAVKRRGNNKGLGTFLAMRGVKRNPSFLEVSVRTPEPTYNIDNDSPAVDGVTCRGCSHFILDQSDEESHKHAGWHWCTECYYDLPEVQEGLADIAVRGDYE